KEVLRRAKKAIKKRSKTENSEQGEEKKYQCRRQPRPDTRGGAFSLWGWGGRWAGQWPELSPVHNI
ncbi:hypothetical protein BLX87_24310, partial [Bacillus sp. VT-16-64]